MRWVLFGLAAVALIAGAAAYAGGPNRELVAWIAWLTAAVLFGAGAIVDAQARAERSLGEGLAKLMNKPVVVTSPPDAGTHGGYQDGVE